MKQTIVDTLTATIYVGTSSHCVSIGRKICQSYCDSVGLCLTFTDTLYIYTDGNEKGIIVGLINYPRFPSTRDEIKTHAIRLATLLKKAYRQQRCSIVMNDQTIMLGE